VRTYIITHWRPIAGVIVLGGVALFLLFWRLGGLVPAYSTNEFNTYNQALSFHALLDNPTNMPYSLLVHAAAWLHPHSILVSRIVSASLAFLVLALFYWLIQHWHGHRIAWMASMLFATSTRFLHTARLGTAQILLFGLFGLIVYGVWLKGRSKLRFAVPVSLFVACLLVYIPGMIWFVVAGLIWQWRAIADKIWKTPVWITLPVVLPALALLFPLGWSIVKTPKLAMTFLGLPQHFPHLGDLWHNLYNIPLSLFYTHSTITSDLGTPALLTLDSFAIIMFIFGCYLYIRRLKMVRANFLIAIFGIGIALITLGTMTVNVLLPFIYVIIAAGVTYLLGQWMVVFPRNVFARSTGIVLLSFVIALCCIYNFRRYFVAWPTSPTTRTIFSRELS